MLDQTLSILDNMPILLHREQIVQGTTKLYKGYNMPAQDEITAGSIRAQKH